ncbi:MAG TPA: nucleotidyltransferase domain-containing protein [Ignavibacteria bacterium]|nr:nucleotidyltransferase domain-containing protein [Ignavibacteria bacterium]
MGEIEIRDSINKYINLLHSYFDLKMVVLYGSFAKGNADENSDIDLAVFIKKNEENRDHLKDSALLNRLICNADCRIEPVLYYDKELESIEEASFIAEILNSGIVLFKN